MCLFTHIIYEHFPDTESSKKKANEIKKILPPLSKVDKGFHHELRNVAVALTPLFSGHPHTLWVEVRVHEGSTSDEVILYVIGYLMKEGGIR